MICVFSGSTLVGSGAVLAAPAPQATAPTPAYPGTADLTALSAQLPDDPVEAVQALVEMIYGADEFQAQVAVGELLLRAGLPLVSIDGPVIGTPDNLVLVDAPIYIELIPDLVRALRRGVFYTPTQLADMFLESEVVSGPLDPMALVAGLGQWGKAPDSPVESLVAGTIVRALAGRRLQVLYDGSDLGSIQLDPLQVILVLAHAISPEAPAVKPTTWVAPPLTVFERLMGVQGVVRAAGVADAGPCDALNNITKPITQQEGNVKWFVKKSLTDEIKRHLNEAQKKIFDASSATLKRFDKGTAILSTLLLLLGATIQVMPDKYDTHFGHVKPSPATHVHVGAVALFDSAIANERVACYGLAGVDVPPSGPMVGFRIRWSMDQPKGGPLGVFLAPIPADKLKLDSCGSCGEVTDSSGSSILELMPPIENVEPPKDAPLLFANVQVTATLDKDEFPFKEADLLSFIDKPMVAIGKKTWDIGLAAIRRIGLPSQSVNISVGYHGSDIYVSKGETPLFLVYWNGSIKMDIYTCNGLGGQWTGNGGIGAATQNALGYWPEIIGVNIPDNVDPFTNDFHFKIDPNKAENTFDITPGVVTGTMRTDILTNSNANHIVNRRLARMVGEVEVLFGGSRLATFTFGASTVYPVYWVPEDPRCPPAGAYFEN